MLTPGFALILATLLLLAAAIVVHINTATLSLPIAGTTLVTILLPPLAALNALLHPRLLHAARATPSPVQRAVPPALQSLQAILTTALATLLLQHVLLLDPLPDCALGGTWQRLFRARDASAVRAIQDALDCCGFRSVRDRAWPFPGGAEDALRCAARFDRATPCAGPWRAALRRDAGLALGVVLATALLQIVSLAVVGEAGSWRDAWWARGLSRRADDDGVVRPLLGPPLEALDEGADSDVPVSYGDLSPTARPRRGVDDGVAENGARVLPSPLGNAWGAD